MFVLVGLGNYVARRPLIVAVMLHLFSLIPISELMDTTMSQKYLAKLGKVTTRTKQVSTPQKEGNEKFWLHNRYYCDILLQEKYKKTMWIVFLWECKATCKRANCHGASLHPIPITSCLSSFLLPHLLQDLIPLFQNFLITKIQEHPISLFLVLSSLDTSIGEKNFFFMDPQVESQLS